jgi:hypothetical protein
MFCSGESQGKRRNKAANPRSRSSGTLLSQDEAIDQRCGMHRWIVLLDGRRRAVALAENNSDSALALFVKSKNDLVR